MDINASSDRPIRVVIIYAHTLMRAGLVLFIDQHPRMCVVGEAGEINEALGIVSAQKPDIILLTLDPDDQTSLENITKVLKVSNHSRIILVSRHDKTELNTNALKNGALGIVFVTEEPEILIKAIKKVNEGEVWIERSQIADIIYGFANNKEHKPDPELENIEKLTSRERDLIQFIGRGFKNRQIAEQLCLSETTIRHHLTSIYQKLDVKSRLELLVFANRHGLTQVTTHQS